MVRNNNNSSGEKWNNKHATRRVRPWFAAGCPAQLRPLVPYASAILSHAPSCAEVVATAWHHVLHERFCSDFATTACMHCFTCLRPRAAFCSFPSASSHRSHDLIARGSIRAFALGVLYACYCRSTTRGIQANRSYTFSCPRPSRLFAAMI